MVISKFSNFSNRLPAIIAFSIFTLTSLFGAPAATAQGARGPATQEEMNRVVQLAERSDKDAVATMSSSDGRWFERWADEVPDYQFGPDKVAFWLEMGAAKGDVKRITRFHHTLSSAVYQVKNKVLDPNKNPDQLMAKSIAAMEGMLRAYENILAKNPEVRSAAMDDAIVSRNKGSLAEFIKALPPMPSH